MNSDIIRKSVLANAAASLAVDDRYSDIDLRVIVADATYESVIALREQLPTTWGPFLFHETVGPNCTVSYYEPLTKADVCAEAVHHLLVCDDLLSGRAPFGSSKRERLVSGQLTDVAIAATALRRRRRVFLWPSTR